MFRILIVFAPYHRNAFVLICLSCLVKFYYPIFSNFLSFYRCGGQYDINARMVKQQSEESGICELPRIQEGDLSHDPNEAENVDRQIGTKKGVNVGPLVPFWPLTAQTLALNSGYRAPCIGIERYSKFRTYFQKKYANPSPLDLYDGYKSAVTSLPVGSSSAVKTTTLLNALEEGNSISDTIEVAEKDNANADGKLTQTLPPSITLPSAKPHDDPEDDGFVDDFRRFYELIRAIDNGNAFEATGTSALPVITPPTVMDVLLLEEQRIAAAAATGMTTGAAATASAAVAPITSDLEASCHSMNQGRNSGYSSGNQQSSNSHQINGNGRMSTAKLQENLSNQQNILTHPINCYSVFGNNLTSHRLIGDAANNPRCYDYLSQAPEIFSKPGYLTDSEWQEYLLKPMITIRNQANRKRWQLYHYLHRDCPFLPKTLTWTYKLKKCFDSIPGMIANFPPCTIIFALLHLILYIITMIIGYTIDCYHVYLSTQYRIDEKIWFHKFLNEHKELDSFVIDEKIVEEMHELCNSLNAKFSKLHFAVETKERFDEYVRLQQQLELGDDDESNIDSDALRRRYNSDRIPGIGIGLNSTMGGSSNNGSQSHRGGRSVGSSIGGGSSVNGTIPSNVIPGSSGVPAGSNVHSHSDKPKQHHSRNRSGSKSGGNHNQQQNHKRFQIFEDERLEHKTNAMFIKIQFNTYVPEEELIYELQ